MSTISYSKFRDQLRRWGVTFVEHSRRDRCTGTVVPWYQHEARRYSDCARRGWDAHGIAIHHTGGPTAWEFVWDGRLSERIPGPLYIAEIYEDGVAHLTGWGVSNNVGRCDKTVRDRVLAGRMPISGGNVIPGADDYSAANSEFYGIAYRGTAPNSAQRRTALRMCAAICEAHGSDWNGGSIAGHKELTQRKPDPEGENMSAFRADVNALLKAGPFGGSTPPPTEEDDMPLDNADLDKIEQRFLRALRTPTTYAAPSVKAMAVEREWGDLSLQEKVEHTLRHVNVLRDALDPTQDLIRQAVAEAASDPDVAVDLDAGQIDALGAAAAKHLLARIGATDVPA